MMMLLMLMLMLMLVLLVYSMMVVLHISSGLLQGLSAITADTATTTLLDPTSTPYCLTETAGTTARAGRVVRGHGGGRCRCRR